MNMLTNLFETRTAETRQTYVGKPVRRSDGPLKVTGAARYAAEYATSRLAYGVVLSSAIAKGRIRRMAIDDAAAVPGVIAVLTHHNRPDPALFNRSYRDDDAPPGDHFRPLYDDRILYSAQPIALVLAEDIETARYAATLVTVEYDVEAHQTDLAAARMQAHEPRRKKPGFQPPPDPRGDAAQAYRRSELRHAAEYRTSIEHHNPMELHASTVVWKGDGSLIVHDKTQGAYNTQNYVCRVFGLKKEQVQVVAPFIGGAFGSGLRPQYQLFLAVMAARLLRRSVRVELTREQMFSFSYRPEAIQTLALGADRQGKLTAVRHEAIQNNSRFEDYQEVIVNWSGLLYHCPDVELTYKLAPLDLATPGDMRAPGGATGVNVLEVAIDELAYAADADPLAFRLLNYAERDENQNKDFTSKELRACFAEGAERFGWSRRSMAPRSMRDGGELVGWGLATGAWEAYQMKTSARATLLPDGRLSVSTAAADIGTGTYTILAQIAADCLGLPLDRVVVRLGDSALPEAPLSGGSWTAASAGSAVKAACEALQKAVLEEVARWRGSPFARSNLDDLAFTDGMIRLCEDADAMVSLLEVARRTGAGLTAEASAAPSPVSMLRYARYAHSAVFAEVKVDQELGQVRVTRIVNAVAAGRILNPRTARSQIIGGVVFAIGKALHEESRLDHRLGRFMNRNLADYHIPAHADVPPIEVHFVDEKDAEVNPLGVKGVGEIGVVGTSAAIANAIFHATGRRIRSFPVTIDKLL